MWASLSLLRTLPRTVAKMYDISDYMRDQAALRSCEERWLSPDEDDYMDDYDDDYPYDTTEEAYD